jgi:hypothetical protein
MTSNPPSSWGHPPSGFHRAPTEIMLGSALPRTDLTYSVRVRVGRGPSPAYKRVHARLAPILIVAIRPMNVTPAVEGGRRAVPRPQNRSNGVQLRPARYDIVGAQKSLYPKPIELAPLRRGFLCGLVRADRTDEKAPPQRGQVSLRWIARRGVHPETRSVKISAAGASGPTVSAMQPCGPAGVPWGDDAYRSPPNWKSGLRLLFCHRYGL